MKQLNALAKKTLSAAAVAVFVVGGAAPSVYAEDIAADVSVEGSSTEISLRETAAVEENRPSTSVRHSYSEVATQSGEPSINYTLDELTESASEDELADELTSEEHQTAGATGAQAEEAPLEKPSQNVTDSTVSDGISADDTSPGTSDECDQTVGAEDEEAEPNELPEKEEGLYETAGSGSASSTLSSNQSMATAANLPLGGTVSDVIQRDSSGKWWKVNLTSGGRLHFSGKAGLSIRFVVYDSVGDELDSWVNYYDSTTERAIIDNSIYLRGGLYCIYVENWSSGVDETFSFSTSFEGAGASFPGGHGSISSYNSISIGSRYVGLLAVDDAKTFYRFSLSSAGRVSLSGSSYTYRTDIYLYDSNGNEIWSHRSIYKDDTSGRADFAEELDLTKGTYFLAFTNGALSGGEQYFGRFLFSTSFLSAQESIVEQPNGSNNTIDDASEVGGNLTYRGQTALNDETDFYKFEATSNGTATLEGTSYADVRVRVYNNSAEEIEDRYFYIDTDTGRVNFKLTFDITKGAFYVSFSRRNSIETGIYTYKASGPIASASGSQEQSKLPAPSSVSLSPVSPRGVRVSWSRVSGADGYVIMRAPYGSGSYVKVGSVGSGYTLYFVDSSAAPGTSYYYSVVAFVKSGSTYTRGNWSYRQSVRTAPAAPTITSVSATSSGVRLSWSKVTGADGYVIMRCDGTSGDYVKIATYGSGSSVSALDTTAVAGRTYSYSVIAFIDRGGVYTRGAWAAKRTVTAC